MFTGARPGGARRAGGGAAWPRGPGFGGAPARSIWGGESEAKRLLAASGPCGRLGSRRVGIPALVSFQGPGWRQWNGARGQGTSRERKPPGGRLTPELRGQREGEGGKNPYLSSYFQRENVASMPRCGREVPWSPRSGSLPHNQNLSSPPRSASVHLFGPCLYLGACARQIQVRPFLAESVLIVEKGKTCVSHMPRAQERYLVRLLNPTGT